MLSISTAPRAQVLMTPLLATSCSVATRSTKTLQLSSRISIWVKPMRIVARLELYDALDNPIVGDLFASANANVDAFTLDVALNVPVTSVIALIVKGGAYAANTELELSVSSDIPGTEKYNYSKTDSSNGLHYGIGINFKVTDTIGLRAEWERLVNVEANNEESDVDLLSAALIYNF